MKFKPDNINPQGRPKVYFCCHPNDFDNYFDVVSNEILEKQKCTIWYAENEDERNDEYFSNLKEMQLFVMPVTTKLLCTENVAIDVEFKFAIENHIPVLPLMQESGLANLFNKKCGDLQFLDKQSTDITAISYNEKLDKYLSSVLIGDEVAEKIRAAFDAYVFLSYRKKDRKYAQELMRIIHKNEFCRDIAIWYDEFLIPGENFNDSIIQAIQKSGLFLLTVTPNLVNEKNYVMTEEYPLAQKEGKVIIPAEMVSTNRSDLFSCFKNIPECIDARNEDELSNILLKTIKEIAIKENKKTPEHNFFIGLAYLGGVDVEVDYERARSLIISAAGAGVIEAIKKLVAMYSAGMGVECNWSEALVWQEKAVEYYKQKYLIEKNFNNGLAYFEQLDTMMEILYSYSNSFVVDTGSTSSRNITSRNLSDYCYDKIHELVLEYQKLSLDMYETECTVKPYMLLIITVVRLSEFYEKIGEIMTALEYADLSHSYYQNYMTQSKSEKYSFALIFVNLRRGRLLNLKGEFAKAKEILEIIPDFYCALDDKICEIVSEVYLIEVYIELGDINKNLKNFLIAENNYLSALEIICKYHKYDKGYAVYYCSVICKLVTLYLQMQEIDKVKTLVEKGLEIIIEFEKEFSDKETTECLAKLYEIYGDFCKQTGDIKGARDYYNQAHLIRWKTVNECFELRSCVMMAILYRKIGELNKDISMLELALDIFEEACDSCPEIIEIQDERENTKQLLKILITNET